IQHSTRVSAGSHPISEASRADEHTQSASGAALREGEVPAPQISSATSSGARWRFSLVFLQCLSGCAVPVKRSRANESRPTAHAWRRPYKGAAPMLTRREMIKLGLGAPAILRFGRLRSSGWLLDGHDQQSSPRLTPFLDELPAPNGHPENGGIVRALPVLTRKDSLPNIKDYALQYVGNATKFYEISTEERLVQFHQQLPPTSVWGYVDKNQPPSGDPP